MGMLHVLSRRGDDRITWDAHLVDEGDPEAASAVREAERIFATQRSQGATAFRLQSGRVAVRIDSFDPAAERIVIVPRVVGG